MNADILYAVKSQLGAAEDNYHRASSAFRGLSQEQMGQEYGQSGETRQAILDGYRQSVERWTKALEECK